LNKTLSAPTSSSIDKFIDSGIVFDSFVVPFVQVTSLMYGVYNVYKQMRHRTVNAAIVSKHLASCKRTAVVYFICMALLVITIDPFNMTRSTYKEYGDDDDYLNKFGIQTYPSFAFSQFTTVIFLNLSVTCYLTVMLLFTSLSLMQIKTIQQHMIEMIDTNTLITDDYMDAKDEIMSLKNGSYLSAQLLTITAAINVVAFLFTMWLNSYLHISGAITYGEMILYDFIAFPYLLKEIVFFFYVLYLAASINTLHDKFIDIANKKFWEVKKKIDRKADNNNTQFTDLSLLWSCTMFRTEDYCVFRLGRLEVRRGGVIATMVGFILYCLYMLLKFKRSV